MKTKLTEDTRIKLAVYRPQVLKIIAAVADYYNLTALEIGSRNRFRGTVQARRRVCYYVKEYVNNCPLSIVGYILNHNRPFDHTSIINYIKKHRQEMTWKRKDGSFVYPELRAEDFELRKMIESKLSTCKTWLEDFATSSGNFMIAEAV